MRRQKESAAKARELNCVRARCGHAEDIVQATTVSDGQLEGGGSTALRQRRLKLDRSLEVLDIGRDCLPAREIASELHLRRTGRVARTSSMVGAQESFGSKRPGL